MDKAQQLHNWYSELKVVDDAIANFPAPCSAVHPEGWTQEEADKYASLIKRRTDIRSDIAQLEATPN